MAYQYLTDVNLTLPSVWSWAKRLVQDLNNQGAGNDGVPIGARMFWHSADAPQGWLVCDGRSVNVKDYPSLYVLLKNTYGGDSSTFNLPNYTDKIFMGAGSIVAADATAGGETVTLTVDNLPAHTHAIDDPKHTHAFTSDPHTHTVDDPQHTHPAAAGSFVETGTGTAYGGNTSGASAASTGPASTGITLEPATVTGTNAEAATGITLENTGSGKAFDILPPVVGQYVIMKVL